jgi:biopolymer transport protein ExbD
MRTLILGCTLICSLLAQSTQNAGNPPAQVRPAPVVTITKDEVVWLNEQRIGASRVAATVQQRFGAVEIVYLRADKETPWTSIVRVMTALSSAKPPMTVQLVTSPEPSSPKAAPPGRRQP